MRGKTMRNYSILFIDDEKIIRESFLKLVDWKENNFDVKGTFNNGKTALDYLNSHTVDIIVSDINMPFLNGIDLLDYIRKHNMKTRVILLTGYEYFEYASKAVQLKAFDFLLKPITTEKLLEAVKNAAYDIEKEEKTELTNAQFLAYSQGNFVNQLFYDRIPKDNINSAAEKCSIHSEAKNYLIIKIVLDAVEGRQISENEGSDIKKSIADQIKEKKDIVERQYTSKFDLYFAENINIDLLLLLVNRQTDPFISDMIKTFAETILNIEKTDSNFSITVGVGKAVSHLDEIPESFKNVCETLKKRHIVGIRKIFFVSNRAAHHEDINKVVLPTDSLLQHIRMGMTEDVQSDIKGIYDFFRKKEFVSLESVKMVTTELAITVFKGKEESKDSSVSYLNSLNQIQKLITLEEMENCITKLAVHITEQRKIGGSHKAQIAERAIAYLKNNYANEQLSLNDIAAYLNISIPYLAVVFKQETNQNFSTHLLQIRMDKAKEYLKTSAMTVSEIAEKIGYSSPQYFAVCFKKYTGVSPVTYKNQ